MIKGELKIQRRPILLLEVLIAFALVALCVLPLIFPHVFILRSEKKFNATVELDHVTNLLYANILEKLYQNDIPWSDLENEKPFSIDHVLLEAAGYKKPLAFTGTYQFTLIKQKPSKPVDKTAYIFELTLKFTPKPGLFLEKASTKDQDSITYTYKIALGRSVK
jgi:hypothetical protein